eukprot:TRINITY_DN32708_c0_g1_i1.p1 TRINITY_DN32708_c0_g1~~TRINITY_DN32708_c0_g1_i1.p1  ORF type:complete len:199 (-),score=45.44 TRINITY_DN32708_c0_g1_i1:35-631(-)
MPGTCPRCSKAVYFAEEVKALGTVYHRLCFNCSNCKKMLDSGSIAEHEDNIYCKSCYGKSFGPKGYGYGGGAGTLSMDSGSITKPERSVTPDKKIQVAAKPSKLSPGTGPTSTKPKPKFGGGDICPKCNKTVYFAEAMKADGSTWHKTCFTCNQCNKNLDSSLVCEREGKVYCKSCYGKNFGPKGVGYGIGAGALQTT